MKIIKKQSLRSLNTLGFEQFAAQYAETHSLDELQKAIKYAAESSLPVFVLGGGSNIVLTKDIEGLVLRQRTKNIRYERTGETTRVICDAGVRWHDLVLDTLEHGLYGLENLSLIPGDVGAAPIQNIGAYGVELDQILENVTAVDLRSGKSRIFNHDECQFDYRDSVFKSQYPGQFAITSIQLVLSNIRSVVTHYEALATELADRGLNNPTAKEISSAVCHIRSSKLPDPEKIGNAGSFFKNPIVSELHYQGLKQKHPGLPGHQQAKGEWKIPAAWLIDSLGWKGVCRDGVCVHSRQALVLVHQGGSTGRQLLAFADEIKQSVLDQFDVILEQEPINV